MHLIKFCMDGDCLEPILSGATVLTEDEGAVLMAKIKALTKTCQEMVESAFDEPDITIEDGVTCRYVPGADFDGLFDDQIISVTEAETVLRLLGNCGLKGAPVIGFFPDIDEIYDNFMEKYTVKEEK